MGQIRILLKCCPLNRILYDNTYSTYVNCLRQDTAITRTMQCSDWGLISLYVAFLLEDSARLQELAADSERIIPNLVTNLDLQLEKDNLISEVMETNEEELQLQLKEVGLCTYSTYSTYCSYITYVRTVLTVHSYVQLPLFQRQLHSLHLKLYGIPLCISYV